jgi:hypothetical protein
MANALRGSMVPPGYKHALLGLILLQYICAAFEVQHAKPIAWKVLGAYTDKLPSPCCSTTIRV